MKELIDTLLTHVRSNGMEVRYLRGAGLANRTEHEAEELLESMTAALSPADRARLEAWLKLERDIDGAEAWALFACGLSVGLTLGGMTGETGGL